MTSSVPHLALSHGQVTWCLAGGCEPSPPLPDQVRYLRQLGIPFSESEQGQGRGVRLSYGFYHLIELGVAYEALRRRIQPRYLKMLVEDRAQYRNVYRAAYFELAQHPELFDANPSSRSMFGDELFIRLHDRYSDTPGRISLIVEADNASTRKFGDLVEQYEGEPDRDVIALKSLTLSLLSLAKIAPKTRPGPRG